MHETILRVEDIQKVYGNKGNLTRALDHLSFSVQRGEFLGIMGPSGSRQDDAAQLYRHHRPRDKRENFCRGPGHHCAAWR